MLKRILLCIALVAALVPVCVYGSAPMEKMKTHIGRTLDILGDPALRGAPGKKTKEERIRIISEELFDFTELSRRSLGKNWSKLSTEQQEEFLLLFKALLMKTYADRMTAYTDEKVIYGKEIVLSEKTVEMQTTLATKTDSISIDYRLMLGDGQWRVYDVVIEGVGLIDNYRSQFREILAGNPPQVLIDKLRKKAEQE